MGNLKEQDDWVIEPAQMNDIIDFCHATAKEGRIRIFPADCIGYYTNKELEIKSISYQSPAVPLWDGCNAGVRGFGILQNGTILGCTSIRSEEFHEGSIKDRPLREIWEDKAAFAWRRAMTPATLTGDCALCNYKQKCLGGCPNTRLTMTGSIDSENCYCAYNFALKAMKVKYDSFDQPATLLTIANNLAANSQHQEASYALTRLLTLAPDHYQALLLKGYCDYMCGNYEACRDANKAAIAVSPSDPLALRGYAVALHKLGDSAEGIRILREAIHLDSGRNSDLLYDLAVMEKEGATPA
jgi:radical SAM protein with 4Fe4S-binding SPASM domain